MTQKVGPPRWGIVLDAGDGCGAVRFDARSVAPLRTGEDIAELVGDVIVTVDAGSRLRAALAALTCGDGLDDASLVGFVCPDGWRAVHRKLVEEALGRPGPAVRFVPRLHAVLTSCARLDQAHDGVRVVVVHIGLRITEVWHVIRHEDAWLATGTAAGDLGVVDADPAGRCGSPPAEPIGAARARTGVDLAGGVEKLVLGVVLAAGSPSGLSVIVAGPGAALPGVAGAVERAAGAPAETAGVDPQWQAAFGAARHWIPLLDVGARQSPAETVPAFVAGAE
ncbi:hypothetical protein ACFPIJ_22265 [Dactylosporangium cerinum]|uniref:Uncharacterized protein n=1 Tax=Dactylosporangium cerinum TaxID=1434730 RepID=A0ABV9VYR3_9ACTN